MSASFADLIRSPRQMDSMTVEHHYHVDFLNAITNYQLNELNSRFSEQATELLVLSAPLNPNDAFKSYNANDIYNILRIFLLKK
jgi:hypothetical protein